MMSEEETLRNFRGQILDDPGMILEDRDVMSALIKPSREDRKVVDLRGVMVDRLEERLDRLEDTHRNVVAAAYENLAGTNQIHRAVLAILDPTNFDDFLSALGSEVAANLSIDVIRLCLESPSSRNGQPLGPPGPFRNLVIGLQPGGCDHYISDSRQTTTRKITLRQSSPKSATIYGEDVNWVQSEVLIKLDMGQGKRPAMLVFGSEDPHRFHPDQGTDLLNFIGSVFERALRRWLA
jgi:uncharacterized protein YigA (DUF484 family)